MANKASAAWRLAILLGLVLQLAAVQASTDADASHLEVLEQPHADDQPEATPDGGMTIEEKVQQLRAQLMSHTMSGDFEKANEVLEELKKHTPTRAPTQFPTKYDNFQLHWWDMDAARSSAAVIPVDCEVGDWSAFWPCSKPCGTGVTSRSRGLIHDQFHGGKSCPPLTEGQNCADEAHCVGDSPPPVDVDCAVGDWASWSSCSRTCGTGTQFRSREVIAEKNLHGHACPFLSDDKDCHLGDCLTDIPTTVTAVVGGINDLTHGSNTEVNVNPDVVRDCSQGGWTPWSVCSAECGHGYQSRTRTVDVEPANGGIPCPPLLETDNCLLNPCPVEHASTSAVNCTTGAWSSWSECSQTCGHGSKFRSKSVTIDTYAGGDPCPSLSDTANCFLELCPDDLITMAAAAPLPAKACNRAFHCEIDQFCVYNLGSLAGECQACISKPMDCYPPHIATAQHVWTAESCEIQCGSTSVREQFCTSVEITAERDVAFVGGASNEPTLRDVEDEFDRFGYHNSPMTSEIAQQVIWDLLDFHAEDKYLCHLLANFDKYLMDFGIDGKKHITANQFHDSIRYQETVSAPPLEMGANHTVHSPIVPNDLSNDMVAAQTDAEAPVAAAEQPALAELPAHATESPSPAPTATPTPTPTSTPTYTPVDCVVGAWGFWDPCSQSCGEGVKTRHRSIHTDAAFDGQVCPELMDYEDCLHPCPVDCEYTWAVWGECSTTCGRGLQTRLSVIVTQADDCPVKEDRVCNMEPCIFPTPQTPQPTAVPTTPPSFSPTHAAVNCGMSEWSGWSECSEVCGGGIRAQSRSMLTPPRYGGEGCGTEYHEENCNTGACPLDCEHSWNEWSDCSRSCGGGTQRRDLNVVRAPANGGFVCPNGQERVCNTEVCATASPVATPTVSPTFSPTSVGDESNSTPLVPVNCLVGTWSVWGDCSVACGMGVEERYRNILVAPEHAGEACPVLREAQGCAGDTCSSSCTQTWGEWGACGASCGIGIQMRFPINGGGVAHCSNFREDRVCNTLPCPTQAPTSSPTLTPTALPTASTNSPTPVATEEGSVDCVVAAWGDWSACSEPCGTGIHMRMRSKQVWPEGDGALCPSLIEGANCNTQPCPMNCEHTWLAWNSCSKSCGQGVQVRAYTVHTHGGYGGTECPAEEQRVCNTEPCPLTMAPTPSPTSTPTTTPTTASPTIALPTPVHCEVGAWTTWTECSEPCNIGVRTRERDQLVENIHGGRPCPALFEGENCNTQVCSLACDFHWEDWRECTKTCGTGVQVRFASVTLQAIAGGESCPDQEERVCSTDVCPTSQPTQNPTANPTETSSPTLAPTAAPTVPDCQKSTCSVPCANAEEHCCSDFVNMMGMCDSCIAASCPTPAPTTGPTSPPPSCDPAACTVCDAGKSLCCNAFVHQFNMCGQCTTNACPVVPDTSLPTSMPTISPTFTPTASPTLAPTSVPTIHPTLESLDTEHQCAQAHCTVCEEAQVSCCSDFVQATGMCGNCVSHFCTPSSAPSAAPSKTPTFAPTSMAPTGSPTEVPTTAPSSLPTTSPTDMPTAVPTPAWVCNEAMCNLPTHCHSSCCNDFIQLMGMCTECYEENCVNPPPPTDPPSPTPEPSVPPTAPAVDCVVGDWNEWGDCSEVCGGGVHSRTRGKVQSNAFGGNPCPALFDGGNCNTHHCPVNCEHEWEPWPACSVTCGGGRRTRTFQILRGPVGDGDPCPMDEEQTCRTDPCPTDAPTEAPTEAPTSTDSPTFSPTHSAINCLMGTWSSWGECTVDCGNGVNNRTRTQALAPLYGGTACGVSIEDMDCNTHTCSIICPFSEWGTCSKPCGRGVQTRTVAVATADCPNNEEERVCNTLVCPTQSPTLSPTEAPTAAPTTASPTDTPTDAPTAEPTKLPIDCVAGSWSEWGTCTEPCGKGVAVRTRSIVSQAQFGGAECGYTQGAQDCNLHHCAVACPQEFTAWSACTQACDGGTQSKSLVYPLAEEQVDTCSHEKMRACNEQACDAVPTGAPTIASTDAPTDAPTDALPTGAPTNAPTNHHCDAGSHYCWADAAGEASATCTATIGDDYTCECPAGYIQTIAHFNHVDDLDEALKHECAVTTAPTMAPTAHHCDADSHYCWADSDGSASGTCTPSVGDGYTCDCPADYLETQAHFDHGASDLDAELRHACAAPTAAPTVAPTATLSRDCVVGAWANTTACSVACGNGVYDARREILEPALGEGQACPILESEQTCDYISCASSCVREWGSWSACTQHCSGGTQYRMGLLIHHNVALIDDCPLREERVCNAAPCLTSSPTALPTIAQAHDDDDEGQFVPAQPTVSPTSTIATHCFDACPACCMDEDGGGLHQYCNDDDEVQRGYAQEQCQLTCGVCVPATVSPTDSPTAIPTQEPTKEAAACSTESGDQRHHGWRGAGEGENYCNLCTCTYGLMQCTQRTCGEPTDLPQDAQVCAFLTCSYSSVGAERIQTHHHAKESGEALSTNHHCTYNKYTESCQCWCWDETDYSGKPLIGSHKMGGAAGFSGALQCEDVAFSLPFGERLGAVDVVITIAHHVEAPIQQWHEDSHVSISLHGQHIYRRHGVEHDATTAWVESVSNNGFRVCAEADDMFWHSDVPKSHHIDLDYYAVQSAGLWDGAQTGKVGVMTPHWHEHGAACKIVYYPTTFQVSPLVVGSVEQHSGARKASITHWVENVNSAFFRVCFEAIGDYNNPAAANSTLHTAATNFSSFNFAWMAFDDPNDPLASGADSDDGSLPAAGSTKATDAWLPYHHGLATAASASNPHITCQKIEYGKQFKETPTVLATANHKHFENQVWLETTSRPFIITFVDELYLDAFRVCSVAVGDVPTDDLLKWDWAAFGELETGVSDVEELAN